MDYYKSYLQELRQRWVLKSQERHEQEAETDTEPVGLYCLSHLHSRKESCGKLLPILVQMD